MKRISTLILCTVFALNTNAQNKTNPKDSTLIVVKKDTIWKKGGAVAFTFSQTALKNWAAGGNNSMSFSGLLTPYLNYHKKHIEWNNNLVLAYGVTRNWQPGSFNSPRILKSDDRIDFTSKVGYSISKRWFVSAIVNFHTQFAPGFSDPLTQEHQTSTFLNPSRTITGVGFDYKLEKYFAIFLSPVTINITHITQQVSPTGDDYWKANSIDSGKYVFYQAGAYVNVNFHKDIMKSVNYQSVLALFSNYLNGPQNVAINWQNYLTLKVNKYVSALLTYQFINDNTIKTVTLQTDAQTGVVTQKVSIKPQSQETFGLGFVYKFKN